MKRPLVIAHRGASAIAVENSNAALEAAIAARADFAELDVRLSKDGIPVCCHDPDLSRTKGLSGRVADWTASALDNHGVPPLRAVLDQARGRIPLVLDCKLDTETFWTAIAGELRADRRSTPGDAVIGVRSVTGAHIVGALLPDHEMLGFLPDLKSIEPFLACGGAIVRLWETDIGTISAVRQHGRPIWITAGAPGKGDAGDVTPTSLADILVHKPDGILVNDPASALKSIQGSERP